MGQKINPKDPKFFILYTDGAVDFTDAPRAYVDIYKWGTAYMPRTWGQIVFKEGDGFYVHMECEETNPHAVYTKYYEDVYKDSCMEFFAIYQPKTSDRYINIEMNSVGAFICSYCEHGGEKIPMDTLSAVLPTVKPFKTDSVWGVDLHVPLEMIQNAYGSAALTCGDTILMNLYKCGDDTAIPHFGSWSEITHDVPCFHLPEFFSEVEIRQA